MFKRGSLAWLIWNLIFAVIFIGFGIANLINNNEANYQFVIILILGILIVVDASFRLLFNVVTVINLGKRNLIADTRGHAILCAFELAVGIAVIHLARLIKADITQADFLFRFIGDFVGIAAIVCGCLVAVYGTILVVKKAYRPIDGVWAYLGAALLVTAGILVLIYLTNENVLRAIFVLFGVSGCVTGAMLLFGSIFIYVRVRKQKRALMEHIANSENEGQAIEAQSAEEKPEE